MSFAATFDTFANVSNVTPGQRLVLAAISTFTNKQGTCFPSLKAIAERTSLTVRSVQRHLASLIRLGFIERVYRAGRSALTRINLARLSPAIDPEGGDRNDMGGGDKNDTLNLSNEPINTIPAAPPSEPLSAAAGAAFVVHEQTQEQPKTVVEPSQAVDSTMALPEVAQAITEPSDASVTTIDPPAGQEKPAIDVLAEVPATLLADLGEVRKSKKRPAKPTKTEAAMWWAEAQKAGWSMQQVITTMILHGWARFQADWVQNVPPQSTPGQTKVWEPTPHTPASPQVVAVARAKLAELRAQIVAESARKRVGQVACRPAIGTHMNNTQ